MAGSQKINMRNLNMMKIYFFSSEKTKLNSTFCRSPREPRWLWDPNPLYVLRTSSWHSCSHYIHYNKGIMAGKYTRIINIDINFSFITNNFAGHNGIGGAWMQTFGLWLVWSGAKNPNFWSLWVLVLGLWCSGTLMLWCLVHQGC